MPHAQASTQHMVQNGKEYDFSASAAGIINHYFQFSKIVNSEIGPTAPLLLFGL